MKKIVFMLIPLLLLSGCKGSKEDIDIIKDSDRKIEVRKIKYKDIHWDVDVGDFTDKLDITPEVALKIGEAIMLDHLGSEKYKEKEPYIYIIEDENIIVIGFQLIEETKGGDHNIAIDTKTGEILKMWAGE